MKYFHIYKYLDINKLARFVPYVLKSSPRNDMAFDQGMTTSVGNQAEADQDLCSRGYHPPRDNL